MTVDFVIVCVSLKTVCCSDHCFGTTQTQLVHMKVTPLLLHASKSINSDWKSDDYHRALFRSELNMDFKFV